MDADIAITIHVDGMPWGTKEFKSVQEARDAVNKVLDLIEGRTWNHPEHQ